MARHEARHEARQDKTRQDKTRQDKTRHGLSARHEAIELEKSFEKG
jgi:hypothetical protein